MKQIFYYSESDHLVEEIECEQDLEGGRGEDADVGHHLGKRDDPQHQYHEHPQLYDDHGHSQHHAKCQPQQAFVCQEQ